MHTDHDRLQPAFGFTFEDLYSREGLVRLDAAFLFGLQIEQLLALAAIGVGAWVGLRPMLARHFGRPARARAQADEVASSRANEDSMAA